MKPGIFNSFEIKVVVFVSVFMSLFTMSMKIPQFIAFNGLLVVIESIITGVAAGFSVGLAHFTLKELLRVNYIAVDPKIAEEIKKGEYRNGR